AFGSGKFREMPEGYDRDKAFDLFCGIISDIIVPKLEKYDAVLSIEELNCGETNFINSCRDALCAVKKVNHPRVGILCDYYHMSLAGETASDVPDFAKYITHLHIASPANKRAIPVADDGDGENYSAFFGALKKCGYDKKYLSVEGHIPEEKDVQKMLSDCYGYLSSLSDAF
ncbi:MAG: sugar phosphate isomerase/epimerase, partial [Clostridia bacterium]|nr:sugar phosphate isomerase/epimerase [Clostridia bacterium]